MKRGVKMAMGAVGVVFVAALTWAAAKPNPLEVEQAELRKAGLPASYAELIALEPKEGTDATAACKAYDKAVALLGTSKTKDAYSALNRDANSLSVVERDKYALMLRPVLDHLIEASKADRWPLLKPDGFPDSNKTQGPRTGLYLLGYLAEADARRGEIDLAFEELRAMFRINSFLMQVPNFWNRVAIMGRERALLQHFHRVMLACANDPAAVQKGIDFIRALPPQPDLHESLRLQCSSYLLSCLQDRDTIYLWHESEDVTWLDEVKDRLWYRPRFRRWEAFDVKQQREVLLSFPPGPLDWEVAKSAYENKAKADKGKGPTLVVQDATLSIEILPNVLSTWGRAVAYRRVEIAALRIQLLRLKNGEVPAYRPKLGEDGIDPFTHQPMYYRRDGKGFVIWSLDRDLLDDGGMRNVAGKRNNDIVADF